MQLFDTHCHIHEARSEVGSNNSTQALWSRAQVTGGAELVQRAVSVGVARLLCVGTTLPDSRLAVEFVQSRPECWASIGLHPHDAKEGPSALTGLTELITQPKVVAIGECGLDYFYNHSDKKDQEKALRFQIELALSHGMPVIFHVREAYDDFWPIFDSYRGIRGVLHSFTDSQLHLEKALERGLFIGVNGIVTFTKDDSQIAMYKAIPLTNLLFETDAPYLTPKPYRGSINEPAHVRLVAEFLAQLKGESLEAVARATSTNAQTLLKV